MVYNPLKHGNRFHQNGYRSLAASGSTLLDGLQAWYDLDEASGDRADATGNGYTLTDINTVGSASGKIGNALSAVQANNEILQGTTAGDPTGGLRVSGFPTICAWFKTQGTYTGSNIVFTSQWGSKGINFYYAETGNRLDALAYDSDSTLSIVQLFNARTTYPNLGSDEWHFIVVWVDETSRKITFEVNNDGTERVAAAALNSGGVQPELASRYGAFNLLGTSGGFFDGEVDLAGVWDRNLTDAERDELYNSGSGLAYPFTG